MVNFLGVFTKVGSKISYWGVGNISYIDLDGGYIHVCTYVYVHICVHIHVYSIFISIYA